MVYNTTIQSKIDYGLLLWGHTHSTYVETIQKMQNRACRLITRQYDITISSLFIIHSLHLLNVSERTNYFTNVMSHKIVNCTAPSYLSSLFEQVRSYHSRSTRQDSNYIVPKPNMKSYRRSFSYQAPHLFNNLPQNIRNITNELTFKEMLRNRTMLICNNSCILL